MVSRSTGADKGTEQALPAERLRPLLLSFAHEVAEASSSNSISDSLLEKMLETTLAFHGMGGLPVPLEEPGLPDSDPLLDPKGPPPPLMEEEASEEESEDDSSSEVSEDENDFVPASNLGPCHDLAHIDWDKFVNEVFSKLP